LKEGILVEENKEMENKEAVSAVAGTDVVEKSDEQFNADINEDIRKQQEIIKNKKNEIGEAIIKE
jgi:hypothetical protein